MQIQIKATNFELTQEIKDYIVEKVGSLEKFIHNAGSSVRAWVEVGMTTKHHQSGDIYRAEIQIRLPRVEKGIRTESEKETLYAAIDDAREEMKRELSRLKDKEADLVKKGGRLFKKLISFWRGQE